MTAYTITIDTILAPPTTVTGSTLADAVARYEEAMAALGDPGASVQCEGHGVIFHLDLFHAFLCPNGRISATGGMSSEVIARNCARAERIIAGQKVKRQHPF